MDIVTTMCDSGEIFWVLSFSMKPGWKENVNADGRSYVYGGRKRKNKLAAPVK